MKSFVIRFVALGLCTSVGSGALAQPTDDQYRVALREIRAFGADLTPREKAGVCLAVGGISTGLFHSYILQYKSELQRSLVHLLYRNGAFPVAIVVTGGAWLLGAVGTALLMTASRPEDPLRAYATDAGFPRFLELSEDEQMAAIHADGKLGALVLQLARRLPDVDVRAKDVRPPRRARNESGRPSVVNFQYDRP